MIAGKHYNPQHTASYMADKTTVRLLFSLTSALNLSIDHFEITSAYIHEPYQHTKPVYVKQLSRFNGKLKHPGRGGQFIKNLYGNPSGGYYYLVGAQQCMINHGYNQSEHDPCLFYLFHSPISFIMVALSSDDFLVTATSQSLINTLYTQLASQYNIKRLGPPTQYLRWTVNIARNGAVHISQPDYIENAPSTIRMSDAKGKNYPYTKGLPLHKPDPDDTPTPHIKDIWENCDISRTVRNRTSCSLSIR